MFIDESIITVISGKGGDGAATFRREKFVQFGGPDGGDGGKGGDIIFITDPNINTLVDFRNNKKFQAGDGTKGGTARCTGKYGEDLVIIPEKEMFKYISQRENAEDKKSNLNLLNTLSDDSRRFYDIALKYIKSTYKFRVNVDKKTKLTEISHKSSKKTLVLYLEAISSVNCADALVNNILDYFDDLNQGEEDGDE